MLVKLRRIVKLKDDKKYVSYVLTLPKDVVEALSLSDAEAVEMNVKTIEGEIVLVISKPKQTKSR